MDIFDSWLVNTPIAHRGFFNYSDAPENSLKAFERAIEKGYAIELDIHVTVDNSIVVFHDNQLSRMTGKDGYTKNLTKEQIKEYTLGNSDQTIPTLQEVFDLVKGRTPILIEIKGESTKIGINEVEILKVLKEYDGPIALQSFNPLIMEWFKNNAPEYTRGILSSCFTKDDKNRPKSWIKRFVLKRMLFNKQVQPHFIAYNVKDIPNRFVKKYKNIPLLGWTVTSQEQYLDAVKKLDNIIFQDFEPKI
ncbi:MAG: glycerophosphodiester phosphodiesterase [Clostridia bacterium]|nr:glycerophosphodiester phosphodiesterase [Clostridia bacterium]